MIRHSEERSDEESLFLLSIVQEGFLASLQREASVRALRMTALGAFSRGLWSREDNHPCD
jgi:hypothetical protein